MYVRFEEAKMKIIKQYDVIECSLIEEFTKSHAQQDLIRMKEIATILTHFKRYSQCVDVFIEYSQSVMNNTIENKIKCCYVLSKLFIFNIYFL